MLNFHKFLYFILKQNSINNGLNLKKKKNYYIKIRFDPRYAITSTGYVNKGNFKFY